MKSINSRLVMSSLVILLSLACSLFESQRPVGGPGISTNPAKNQSSPQKTSTPIHWSAPSLTSVFQDPDGFYTLEYPDDWQVLKSGSQQQFCSDNKSMMCFSVSVQRVASANQLMSEDSAFLAKKMENYSEGKRTELTISGYPGSLVEHSYRWRGANLKGFLAAVARNRVGFELMAWAPEQDYPRLLSTFQEIIQTFNVVEYDSAPDYSRWKGFRSTRLEMRYIAGSWMEKDIAAIAAQHEKAYDGILKSLQVDYKGVVTFYLYPNQQAFTLSTTEDAGFALPSVSEVHARWFSPTDHQTYGHELTHIITAKTLGNPSEALLGEGLAVCLDQENRNFKALGKDLAAKGLWLPMGELLGNKWGSKDIGAAYTQSGAVACYLLETYGAAKLKQLYTQANFTAALQQTMGLDLAGLEKNMYAWIGK